MWKVLVLVSCVVTLTSPSVISLNCCDDLTLDELDEVLDNPRLYAKFIECQDNKDKCKRTGKNITVSEEDRKSQSVLYTELGDRDDYGWGYAYSADDFGGLVTSENVNETMSERVNTSVSSEETV